MATKTPFDIITEFINSNGQKDLPKNAEDTFNNAGVSYEFFKIDTNTENLSKKVDALIELEIELEKKLNKQTDKDLLKNTVSKYLLDEYLHMSVECIAQQAKSCTNAEYIVDKFGGNLKTHHPEMKNMIDNPKYYTDDWLTKWIEKVYKTIQPDDDNGGFVSQLKNAFTAAKEHADTAGAGTDTAGAGAGTDTSAAKETYTITVTKTGDTWTVGTIVPPLVAKGGRVTRKNTRKRVRPNKRAFKNRTKSR